MKILEISYLEEIDRVTSDGRDYVCFRIGEDMVRWIDDRLISRNPERSKFTIRKDDWEALKKSVSYMIKWRRENQKQ